MARTGGTAFIFTMVLAGFAAAAFAAEAPEDAHARLARKIAIQKESQRQQEILRQQEIQRQFKSLSQHLNHMPQPPAMQGKKIELMPSLPKNERASAAPQKQPAKKKTKKNRT